MFVLRKLFLPFLSPIFYTTSVFYLILYKYKQYTLLETSKCVSRRILLWHMRYLRDKKNTYNCRLLLKNNIKSIMNFYFTFSGLITWSIYHKTFGLYLIRSIDWMYCSHHQIIGKNVFIFLNYFTVMIQDQCIEQEFPIKTLSTKCKAVCFFVSSLFALSWNFIICIYWDFN